MTNIPNINIAGTINGVHNSYISLLPYLNGISTNVLSSLTSL
jgi:hypothetical protein